MFAVFLSVYVRQAFQPRSNQNLLHTALHHLFLLLILLLFLLLFLLLLRLHLLLLLLLQRC